MQRNLKNNKKKTMEDVRKQTVQHAKSIFQLKQYFKQLIGFLLFGKFPTIDGS